MADQIVIHGLEISSFIGVPEEERSAGQRLTANLVLEPSAGFSALDDKIENTVDYFGVCEEVKRLSLDGPRRLIETLAQDIAKAVLARFRLRAVEVEIRKYILPDTEFVSVRVRRENPPTRPA